MPFPKNKPNPKNMVVKPAFYTEDNIVDDFKQIIRPISPLTLLVS